MGDAYQVYPILELTAMYVSIGGSLLMGGLVINELYQRIRFGDLITDSKHSELEKIAGEDKNDPKIE